MYAIITHSCAGRAHLVSKPLVRGWNLYCCNRCGSVFYKWVTQKMFETAPY